MAEQPIVRPDGAAFIVISITGDTDPVTGAGTVNFAATMDYEGEPNLNLAFYEAQQSSSSSINMIPLAVSPTPTVTWNNGVAHFGISMTSGIFTQLSSRNTHFAVTAQIDGVDSYGIATLGVSLPAPNDNT